MNRLQVTLEPVWRSSLSRNLRIFSTVVVSKLTYTQLFVALMSLVLYT